MDDRIKNLANYLNNKVMCFDNHEQSLVYAKEIYNLFIEREVVISNMLKAQLDLITDLTDLLKKSPSEDFFQKIEDTISDYKPYVIVYIEDCTIKRKSFGTKKELDEFVELFKFFRDNSQDCSILLTFKGLLFYEDL